MARMIGEVTQEELSQDLQTLVDNAFSLTNDRGYLTTQKVPNGTDFNTIVLNGVYWANAWTHANIPILSNGTRVVGVVRVERDSDGVVYQTLTTDTAPIMYRTLRSGVWSAWTNFVTEKTIGGLVSNPNLLINSDFRVWQNGNGKFATQGYTADMWSYYPEGGAVGYVERANPEAQGEHLRFGITTAGGTSNLRYNFEPSLLYALNGKRLTFTMEVSANKDVDLLISGFNGFGMSSNKQIKVIGDNTKQKFSHTFTLSYTKGSSPAHIQAIRIMTSNWTGVIGLYSCKLEVGEISTTHVPRNYHQELLDCQRYFYVGMFDQDVMTCDNTQLCATITTPVAMRAVPTFKATSEIYMHYVDTRTNTILVRNAGWSKGCGAGVSNMYTIWLFNGSDAPTEVVSGAMVCLNSSNATNNRLSEPAKFTLDARIF